ncbi:MAG: hypothetical protein FJY73_09865, partial [Candidatus Eisenbacteria bacterium]|nr:hypothetical protein [Candidatus Eisenbacteria bacterium]
MSNRSFVFLKGRFRNITRARSLWVVLLLALPVASPSAPRYAHVPMDPAWCREVGTGELVATVDTVLLWYNGEKVYG